MQPDELNEEELAGALADESPEEPVPSEGTEGDAAPVEEPAPPEESYFELGERKVSHSIAKASVELYDFLEANPEFSKAMAAYATGQFELVPRGQQARPQGPQMDTEPGPGSLEDDDPAIAELKREIATLRDTVGSYTQNSHLTAVTTAAEQFRSTHELSETEMNRLMQETEKLGILPAIANQTDPFGRPLHSPLSAANEAFERVYWSTPDFREREMAKVQTSASQQNKRHRAHAQISGTSGSVPRSNPAPQNQEEAFQQMVAELESLGRNE